MIFRSQNQSNRLKELWNLCIRFTELIRVYILYVKRYLGIKSKANKHTHTAKKNEKKKIIIKIKIQKKNRDDEQKW